MENLISMSGDGKINTQHFDVCYPNAMIGININVLEQIQHMPYLKINKYS